MTKNIVTGAAGFIGSHIAETLLQRGEEVIGIDEFNDYYDPFFKNKNVTFLQTYDNFELIEADIQFIDWNSLLKDVDVVYHQAAQAGVRASWGQGFRFYTEQHQFYSSFIRSSKGR